MSTLKISSKVKRFLPKALVAAVFAVPLFSTLSCEIGLGSAVDVSAPVLTITYPPSGAVIRDSFVLAGECADDVGVAAVSVQVKNTSTNAVVFSGTANNALTRWDISLNNYDPNAYGATNGWQYGDGTYEVSVYAIDGSGKSSGVSSRTFDIDNTAPVFIIEKPGVTKFDSQLPAGNENHKEPSSYGTTFSVSGTIADLHPISNMSLEIYDKDGNIIPSAAFNETSVSTAGGTEVTVARFIKGNKTAHDYVEYQNIYGQDPESVVSKENSEKLVYCSLKLSDNARIYKMPGDTGVASGNETSSVYLYNDVYTNYLSSKSGAGLSASDVMNIMNGTVSNGSVSKDNLLAFYKNTYDVTALADNRLAFTIDPIADPTYTVNGFDISSDFSKFSIGANRASVSATASSGKDGTLVKTNSIHLFVKNFKNSLTKNDATNFAATVALNASRNHKKMIPSMAEYDASYTSQKYIEDMIIALGGTAPVETVTETSADLTYTIWVDKTRTVMCLADNSSKGDGSESKVTVNSIIPGSTVRANDYFLFSLTGYDADYTEISQSNGYYGFLGEATGTPPETKIDSPANLSFVKSTKAEDLVFSGTMEIGDSPVERLEVSIVVTDEATNRVLNRSTPITGVLTVAAGQIVETSEGSGIYNWSFRPSEFTNYSDTVKVEEAGKSYLYEATLTGYGTNSASKFVQRSVHIDSKLPEIEITSITPDVNGRDFNGSDNTYVNGEISFKANIDETNLSVDDDAVYYEVYTYNLDGNESSKEKFGSTVKLGHMLSVPAQKIDTSSLNNKLLEIVVYAKDKAGNINSCSSKKYNKTFYNRDAHLIIDQETDRPIIEPTNFKKDISFENIRVNSNLFGTTSNNVLSGIVKDDDGVNSIRVGYAPKDSNTYRFTDVVTGGTSTNAVFSYTLPSAAGEYKIKVEAVDTAGKSYGTNELVVNIASSKGAPEINISTPSDEFKSPNTSISVNGTVSSDNEIKEFKRGSDNVTVTNRTWTDTFTTENSEGEFSVVYSAKDKYGQESTKEFIYKIDTLAPGCKITTTGITGTNAVSVENYTFRGECWDKPKDNTAEYKSGIKCIYYKVLAKSAAFDREKATEADEKGWTSVNATRDWKIPLDFVNYGTAIADSDKYTKFAEGSWVLYVYSMDNAGNTSDVNYIDFDVNLNVPEVTSLKAVLNENNDTEVYSPTNKVFDFIYSTFDSYKPVVTTETIEIKRDGVLLTKDVHYTVNETGNTTEGTCSGKIVFNNPTDGTYQISVIAADAYGKKSIAKTMEIVYDTTAPAAPVVENPQDGEWQFSSNAISASGTAADNTGGCGIARVWMIVGSSSATPVTPSSDTLESASWTVLGWSSVGTSSNWIKNGIGDLSDGSDKSIYVASVDKAGNVSAVTKRVINVDSSTPEITDLKYKLNGNSEEAFDVNNINSKYNYFEISGKFADSVSGVTVSATKNGTPCIVDYKNESGADAENGSEKKGSWKISQSSLADDSYEFIIKVTDKSGHSASVTKIIRIDTTAPVMAEKISLPEGIETQNSSYTFLGSVDESGSGVASVVLKIRNSSGQEAVPEVKGTSNWSSSLVYKDDAYKDTVFSTEEEKTVEITITDKAGNSSVYKVDAAGNVIKPTDSAYNTAPLPTFVYDTASPELKSTSDVPEEFMPKTGIIMTGEISDSYRMDSARIITVKEIFTKSEGGSGQNTETTKVYGQNYSHDTDRIETIVAGKKYKSIIRLPFKLDGDGNSLSGKSVDGYGNALSGTYVYEIWVQDSVGNKTFSKRITLLSDLEAPALSITGPATDDSAVKKNSINVENFRFEGRSSDNNRVEKIFYQITTDSTAPSNYVDAEHTNGWISDINGTTDRWNFTQQFKEGLVSETGKLAEGIYYLHAYAKDAAGNIGPVGPSGNLVPVTRKFEVDLNFPVIKTFVDAVESSTTAVQTKTEAYTFIFTATDTRGLNGSPVVSVVKSTEDSEETLTVENNGITVNYDSDTKIYTVEIADGKKGDALYQYRITAEDVAQKITEIERNVRLDTTAPEFDITSHHFEDLSGTLKSDWITGKDKIKIVGSAKDDSGVLAIWWQKESRDPAVARPAKPASNYKEDSSWEAKGWTKANGTASWSINETSYAVGETTVDIVSVDKNGIASDIRKFVFRLDKDAPKIERLPLTLPLVAQEGFRLVQKKMVDSVETDVDTTYITDRETGVYAINDFVIDGFITDDYLIDSIELKVTPENTDGGKTEKIYRTSDNSLTYTKYQGNDNKWWWTSPKFNVNDGSSVGTVTLDDCKWTFVLTAKDAGGQTIMQTNAITVDTVRPSVDDAKITSTVRNGWYKSNQVSVEVEASDANGISLVEYKVNSDTNWTALALNKTTGKYSGVVTVPVQGSNTVALKLTDVAGNVYENSSALVAKVDTKAPVDISDFTVDGESDVKQKLVNGRNNVVVIASVTDDTNENTENSYSEIDTVELIKIGSKELKNEEGTAASDRIVSAELITVEPNKGKYRIDIPAATIMASEGGQIVVRSKDKAGNEKESTLFFMDLDKVAPVVKLGKPANADSTQGSVQVNGNIFVSGTTTDGNKLELPSAKPEFWYTTSTPAKMTGITEADWNTMKSSWTKAEQGVTGSSTAGSWVSENFDTTALTDNTTYFMVAVVSDTAFNVGVSDVIEFNVNQDTDRPVEKITNLTSVTVGTGSSAVTKYTLMYGENSSITGTVSDDDQNSDRIVNAFIATSKSLASSAADGLSKTVVTTSGDKAFDTVVYDGETKKYKTSSLNLKVVKGNEIWTYEYKVSADTGKEAADGTITGCDVTVFSPADGTWTFYPYNTSDGTKTVYFFAEDNNGTEFWTTNTDTLAGSESRKSPYFKFKSDDKKEKLTALEYSSDGTPPSMDTVKITAAAATKDSGKNLDQIPAAGKPGRVVNENLGVNVIAGGKQNRYVQLEIKAYDANGIKGMTLKIEAENGTKTDSSVKEVYKKATSAGLNVEYTSVSTGTFDETTSTDQNKTATWTTEPIDLSLFKTGTLTATVVPYDQNGLSGKGSYTFKLDNTAPDIAINVPASTFDSVNNYYISGSLTGIQTVTGSATDTGDSLLAHTRYLVPKQKYTTADNPAGKTVFTSDTLLKDATDEQLAQLEWVDALEQDYTNSQWGFKFDNGDEPNYVYTNTTHGVENAAGSNVWIIPFYVKAEDNLGNVAIKRDFRILYNPEGDKPVVELIYPSPSNYEAGKNYITLGSTIRVQGSVNIPSQITTASAVYLQFDADNDGDFDDVDKAIVSGSTSTAFFVKADEYYANNTYYTTAAGTTVAQNVTSANYSDYYVKKMGWGYTLVEYDAENWRGINEANQSAWWGVECDLNISSWYHEINRGGELNPLLDASNKAIGTNNFAVRGCGRNANNKIGAWSSPAINVRVDNAAPTSVHRLEKRTAISGTAEATQEYKSGVYLRGQWFIVDEVLDESDLDASSISIMETKNGVTRRLVENTGYFKEAITSADSKYKGYKFFVKIDYAAGTDIQGLSYSIEVNDKDNGSPHKYKATYEVNCDNTAPAVTGMNADSHALAENAFNDIVENNYSWTLGSSVYDATSKFSKVAFFFVRNGTVTDGTNSYSISSNVLLDPMAATPAARKIALPSGVVNYDGKSANPFYGIKIEGEQTTTTTFKVTDSVSNLASFKGRMIYIGGMCRVITKVEGDVITFDTPTGAKDAEEAYLIYAQVVDNQTSSESVTSKAGGTFVLSGDDGDGMPETITHDGDNYTWSASIHSINLADGPATLVVAAFDKAGNLTYLKYPVFVKNNQPRIAKVWLGTDIDGNGTISASELYDYATTESFNEVDLSSGLTLRKYRGMTDATVDATGATAGISKFIAKDKTVVMPEYTGGNGDVYYTWKYQHRASSATPWGNTWTDGIAAASAVKITDAEDSSVETEGYTIDTKKTAIEFAVSGTPKKLAGKLEDGQVNLAIELWDSTDETSATAGTSQKASVKTSFNVDLNDTKAPRGFIADFIWKNKDRNSLYQNSSSNGHIELSSDWKLSKGYNDDNLGDVKDEDPKVSGKIVLRGFAYDDRRLGSLEFLMDNKSLGKATYGTNAYATDEQAEAGIFYNSVANAAAGTDTGKLTDFSGGTKGNADETNASVYAYRGWTSTLTTANGGIAINMLMAKPEDTGAALLDYGATANPYFDLEGHKVMFEVALDTSKVGGTAATNKILQVVAKDAANLDSRYSDGKTATSPYAQKKTKTAAEKDEVLNMQSVQVDIVPYVTGIWTKISPQNKAAPSVYSRTVEGKYPVHSGETITLYGFNMTTGMTVNVGTVSAGTITANTTTTGRSAMIGNGYDFTVPDAASADISVSVNSVKAVNNYNGNTSKGSYTGTDSDNSNHYNMQPNGVNNNILSDDVALDVWGFKTAATPKNGAASNVTMKISRTGRIGVAYSNATVYYSAPFIKSGAQVNLNNVTTQTAIAKNYGWFTHNTFTFDPYGYPYACAQSPDTDNYHDAAFMQFFSRQTGKQINSLGLEENYKKIMNSVRLEAICIKLDTGSGTDGWNTDIDRTQSIAMTATMPEIESAPSNTNKVTMHMAYYDKLTKQIRYRQGTIGKNPSDYGISNDGNSNLGGSLIDLEGCLASWNTQGSRYGYARDSINQIPYKNDGNKKYTQHIYRVAGKAVNGDNIKDAYKVNTTHKPGKYVDIGVLPSTANNAYGNQTVVICWYDSDAKELVLTYGTPNDSDTISNDGMTVGSFAANAQTISTVGGMYCRMAIDPDDGIHIAHYYNTGTDLMYTYVPVKNGVPDFDNKVTYTVDSYQGVGTYPTIDVVEDSNGNMVPHIGYYSNACAESNAAARMAYPVKFTNNIAAGDGTDDKEKFTGNWEITVIPTEEVPIADRINVGLRKSDGNYGTALEIPTGNDSSIQESNSDPVSNTTTIYGNGTANPGVCYAVDEGFIQYAQKK